MKWPNDLVQSGAKLAGLLVEGVTPPGDASPSSSASASTVVSSPAGLAYPTTDLQRLAGAPDRARALFERLASSLRRSARALGRGAGFAAIREAWLASAAGLGGPIRVAGPRGDREGLFEGIDSQAAVCCCARARPIETIESADLTLIACPLARARARR